jgi:hypothetical protein
MERRTRIVAALATALIAVAAPAAANAATVNVNTEQDNAANGTEC